jgi:hypothetical protein
MSLSDLLIILLGSNCNWFFLNRGVPPGARFDPYGPPGIPGFEPNRFARYIKNFNSPTIPK